MQIVPARAATLDRILDETWRIWSDGLTREAYARYNDAQMKTAWGSRSLDRVALVDGERVLSTAKQYALGARLDGRTIRVLGIGAVFTPPSLRSRGAAAALIERMLERAREEGVDCALLFSEIGAAYYERFGFVPIPRDVVWLRVAEKPGAPAILVRVGEERDIPAVTELLRAAAAPARFALEIDADVVRYSVAKKRLLAGLSPPGWRSVEFYVAEEGASAVAFVLLTVSRSGVTLEACGDRDLTGARVGAILQVLRARTPRERPADLAAWLPSGFLPPQLTIVKQRPASELMMIKPLRDDLRVDDLRADDIIYWHGDAF
jgi:GNAT superfamily N-acetyltransferase